MKRGLIYLAVAAAFSGACGKGPLETVSTPTLTNVSSAPSPTTQGDKQFNITGTVLSIEKPMCCVPDAKIEIADGADAGRFVFSDAAGNFVFTGVNGGPVALRVSKAGYQTWSEGSMTLAADRKVSMELFPQPPTDGSGASATARCADGSWTWAQLMAAACTSNGGVAYGVCPGALCKK